MEQESRGITTRLIIDYVRKVGGEGAVHELVAQTGDGLDEAYLSDEHGWVSFEQKNRMFEAAKRILGDPEAPFRIGQSIVHSEAGSALKMGLKMLKTPAAVLQAVPKSVRVFGSTSTFEVVRCNGQEGVLRCSLDPSVTPHLSDCDYNRGLLSAIPMLFGRPPAEVEHPVCAVRGEAPYCEYRVSWRSAVRPDWLLTGLGVAVGLLIHIIGGYPSSPQLDLGLLLQPLMGGGTGFVVGQFLEEISRRAASADMMRKQNTLLLKTNERLIDDLETAYHVQRTLLPAHAPVVRGLDVAGRLFYARRIGGDFYDFIPKGDRLGVCVADVCGKGVQAALFTSVLKNALWQGMYTSSRPKKLLDYVDQQVNRQLPDEMFITMACAVVDTSRDRLTISSAGHEPAILYKSSERRAHIVEMNGLALGLRPLAKPLQDLLSEEELDFVEGDILMLYTDGAYANIPRTDEPREHLARLLEQRAHLSAESIVNEVFSLLLEPSSAGKRDDLTVVVIKRAGTATLPV